MNQILEHVVVIDVVVVIALVVILQLPFQDVAMVRQGLMEVDRATSMEEELECSNGTVMCVFMQGPRAFRLVSE